jgi:hypothetical protein
VALSGGVAGAGAAWADTPTSIGLTGLINMPTARTEPDGTLYLGFSRDQPYSATYGVLQALPWLQISGRYTSIDGTRALESGYGTDKDKSAGFKLRLVPEGGLGLDWMPEVAFGMEDVQGTRLFKSSFLAASKRFALGGFGSADATIGYGRDRIDGLYGGVRLRANALPSWALVAEYDRTDYQRDKHAFETGVAGRHTGQLGIGLEYAWGPLTLQAVRHPDRYSFNVSLAIPLEKRRYVPLLEAGPFAGGAWASAAPRPSARMWREDRAQRQGLLRDLTLEGLRNVRLAYVDGVLSLSVSGSRYQDPSRAVGRVARIALAHAPWETRTLEITWEDQGVAGMTWTFFDLAALDRYLAGTATRAELQQSVTLSYADPAGRTAASRRNDLDATLDALALERGASSQLNWALARYRWESASQTSFEIAPSVRGIFNDPSGVFKYDLGLTAGVNVNLARALWLRGVVRGSVLENISDITQPSNSTLPHVRSDLALYRQGARVKLEQLVVNQLWQPATRVYARASAGLYEEMYGGAGVQALYLAPGGRWAFDGAVDVLRQRDYKGTGFLPYQTTTAIASAHYRLPWLEGVTATLRAGRFLAGDVGARMELKRRFKSGIEVGLWYTRTNGHDETSPGSPSSPYYDKGLFVRIPLGPLVTRDTNSAANFSLAPWNRDVGQMVASPLDLYGFAEQGWLENALDGDGLRGFSDLPAEDTP